MIELEEIYELELENGKKCTTERNMLLLLPELLDENLNKIDSYYNQVIDYDFIMPFSNGLALVKKNNKYGCIDSKGNNVIECQYDHIYKFSEDLILVIKGGKYGYVDRFGKEIIPCVYEDAEEFREDLALVYKNESYKYLDKTGKSVITTNRYYDMHSFCEGRALVRQNNKKYNYKCGYIDKKGKEIIPCIYDDAEDFSDGLAIVELKGKKYYIDINGNKVIDCKNYQYVGSFIKGVAIIKKDNKYGCIDKNGKEIIPCIYDSIFNNCGLYIIVKNNNKYGYYNKLGDEITPCIYDAAYQFSDGLARVKTYGKWIFINGDGKQVIDCNKYGYVSDFNNGLALVIKDGKYGYIDQTGKEIIPCQYDGAHDFSEGLSIVSSNNQRFIINKNNEIVRFETLNNICSSEKNKIKYLTDKLGYAVAYDLRKKEIYQVRTYQRKIKIKYNNDSIILNDEELNKIKKFEYKR